jgi:hypothetical protein
MFNVKSHQGTRRAVLDRSQTRWGCCPLMSYRKAGGPLEEPIARVQPHLMCCAVCAVLGGCGPSNDGGRRPGGMLATGGKGEVSKMKMELAMAMAMEISVGLLPEIEDRLMVARMS